MKGMKGFMILTGADILIETLIEQGTEVVFGYPGGTVLNIYDALYKNSERIKHIITAHEQGAAHAADGYARVSGKVGVVLATSGPGATNLVTGIANAYLDSIPMVAITGNVATSLMGKDSFQEVDIVGVTMPITKHNFVVNDVNMLADTIREAFMIAKSDRPGPVLVDIPKDIQINTAEFSSKPVDEVKDKTKVNPEDIEKVLKLISKSKKPYIYCGGGVLKANASEEILALSNMIDAPIGCSMMGLSAIPSDFDKNLGMTGMHGTYPSSKAKSEADLVFAVGVRFSDRATGDKSKYASHAKIIHIDIDEAEINKNINAYLGITGNVKTVLKEILARLPKANKKPEWEQEIADMKKYEEENLYKSECKLSPQQVIDIVSKYTKANTPIATDVGQHQMWVAQRYKFSTPNTFITSGGLGTMGFGMGAAIGTCVGSKKPTVLFTGDGSFGMNLNELATAVSQNLPIVVIVLNNGVLGMVRQWQTLFYEKHYAETTLNRKTKFAALADAFGATGMSAETPEDFEECLKKAFDLKSPVVIDCLIDKDERVLPMIPAGNSIEHLILN